MYILRLLRLYQRKMYVEFLAQCWWNVDFFPRSYPVDKQSDFHIKKRVQLLQFFYYEHENPHTVRQGAYRWSINVWAEIVANQIVSLWFKKFSFSFSFFSLSLSPSFSLFLPSCILLVSIKRVSVCSVFKDFFRLLPFGAFFSNYKSGKAIIFCIFLISWTRTFGCNCSFFPGIKNW